MQTIKQLPKPGFSILQVLLNLLFFSGGLLLGLLILGLLSELIEVERETLGYGALTLGGMIGGFFATRCSPRPILHEAFATAALMAVLGHILIRSGGNGLFYDTEIWLDTLKFGGPTALGILVGTLLGLRHHRRFRGPVDSGWRWSGISLLMSGGFILIGWFTFLLTSEGELTGGTVVLACIIVAILSGGVTQMLAPGRNFRACGAGSVYLLVIFAVIGIANNSQDAEPGGLVVGGVILCGMTLVAGILGAFLAYKVTGRDEEADLEKISRPQNIPSAQAVDRSES